MLGSRFLFLVQHFHAITTGKTSHLIQRIHCHDGVRDFHSGVQAPLGSVLISLYRYELADSGESIEGGLTVVPHQTAAHILILRSKRFRIVESLLFAIRTEEIDVLMH